MSHFFTLISDGTEANLTVFIPGLDAPITAHSSHANFNALVNGARDGIPASDLVALADLSVAVGQKFERLSERVTVSGGHLFFDGDEVDNSLTKQVVRFLTEDVSDWRPLIAFFENVQQNPDEHSRTQLFEWLNRHDFTITDEGYLVGYKGVKLNGEGSLVSIHSGPAVVDGKSINGHVPNHIGAVVEIARSMVHSDPSVGCSTGLHVGTYSYAKSFGRGALLRVTVNPRDVVSVPTDCDAQKVRVCRYTVEEIIDAEIAAPLLPSDDYEVWDDDTEYCESDTSAVLDGLGVEIKVGSRVTDEGGWPGTVEAIDRDQYGVTVRVNVDNDEPCEYDPSEIVVLGGW